MRSLTKPTVADIVRRLRTFVPPEAADDLRAEDAATAAEVHFAPVGTQALPARAITHGECSTDGFYDAEIDPVQPWIFYADDVAPARVRFTIAHEVGHHLLATAAAELLDDLDVVAGSADGAGRLEETVCHRLAGGLLVPDDLVSAVVGDEQLRPEHIEAVRDATTASWDAIAVRMCELAKEALAVVLLRQPGEVSFCAASSRLGWDWWPRGSTTDPNGPLARSFGPERRAEPETYRYGLGYSRRMFCDTKQVTESLTVGVLLDRPSDGHFEILKTPEPSWREKWEYCQWCHGDRDVGWCDSCAGQRCRDCGRCGCDKRPTNRLCSGCGLQKPRRQGADTCYDCEAD